MLSLRLLNEYKIRIHYAENVSHHTGGDICILRHHAFIVDLTTIGLDEVEVDGHPIHSVTVPLNKIFVRLNLVE